MTEFEDDLRRRLSREADSAQGLPRDLAARIGAAAGPLPAVWLRLAPGAIAVLFVGALGLVIWQAHRSPPPGGPAAIAAASPVVSASPLVTPMPSPSPSAGSSPPAFRCGADWSGGTAVVQPATEGFGNLVALRVAHQTGFDRITFQFAGTGIPRYNLTSQAGTHFVQDASGMPVDVRGSSGIKVVFHGASERDVNGQPTYNGSNDVLLAPPAGSAGAVAEVRQVGDFERVLSWAVGISSRTACTRVLQLNSPSRLVIDVPRQP